MAAVVVVLGGMAWIASSGNTADDEPPSLPVRVAPLVELVDGDNVVGQMEASSALRTLSEAVGFDVYFPVRLQGGFELKSVSAGDTSRAGSRSMRWATADYANDRGVVITVDQHREPVGRPIDFFETLDINVPGAEAYRMLYEPWYFLATADRGYVVTFGAGDDQPSNEEMLKILKELAR